VKLGVVIDIEYLFGIMFGKSDKTGEEFLLSAPQEFKEFLYTHCIQITTFLLLASKGVVIRGGVDVVELYTDSELRVSLHNQLSNVFSNPNGGSCLFGENNMPAVEIKKGDIVAQAILVEHKSYLFGVGTDKERTGGIGSTGR
jgi:hypothetical protein